MLAHNVRCIVARHAAAGRHCARLVTRVLEGFARVEPTQPISPTLRARRYGRTWLLAERAAAVFGLLCLATWGVMRFEGSLGARYELERFAGLQRPAPLSTATPDLSLWDPKRIAAWRTALDKPAPPPLAVLRVPKIGLEVAVLPGTDDFTLNRGVGHIDDTPLPGADGNSGIAGHRDGFFRGLKDIGPGDGIELETLKARRCIA